MPSMRRIFVSLALVILLGASVSCSSDPAPKAERVQANLDSLFERLRVTTSAEEARMITVTIRHVWAHSGRTGVDALMGKAIQAIHQGDYDAALEALDGVTASAPDFVEGWNLRATVNYLREDYTDAVTDIEQVLALEPRHFSALAGLGRIFIELEDPKAALAAFEMALSINPHLAEVREQADELRDELAGVPI